MQNHVKLQCNGGEELQYVKISFIFFHAFELAVLNSQVRP